MLDESIFTSYDQFTVQEKEQVLNKTFFELWNILWYSKNNTNKIHCVKSNRQKKEYLIAENKFNTLRNGYYISNNKIHHVMKIMNYLFYHLTNL